MTYAYLFNCHALVYLFQQQHRLPITMPMSYSGMLDYRTLFGIASYFLVIKSHFHAALLDFDDLGCVWRDNTCPIFKPFIQQNVMEAINVSVYTIQHQFYKNTSQLRYNFTKMKKYLEKKRLI